MKATKIFLIIYCCFCSLKLFAQTPAAIEADLLEAIKKVVNERPSDMYDTTKAKYTEPISDSGSYLDMANDSLSRKLLHYTSKYPFTLTQQFKSLDSAGLWVCTSADNLFRTYSWNTGLGGTQKDYIAIAQYKTKKGTKSTFIDHAEPNIGLDFKPPFYDTIYTLKRNGKVFYIALYSATMSLSDRWQGVQVFAIENDTLNTNVKLIKTRSGVHSKLQYTYTYNMDMDDWLSVQIDEKSAIIKIPVVLENGKTNGNYITYKFTGQYFERVKN